MKDRRNIAGPAANVAGGPGSRLTPEAFRAELELRLRELAGTDEAQALELAGRFVGRILARWGRR